MVRLISALGALGLLAACEPAPVAPPTSPPSAGGPRGQLLLIFDGDFGEVERLQTATKQARFVNVGDAPASLARLSITGEGFTLGEVTSVDVPVGASREVAVHFTPRRNGLHEATISFQSTTLPVLARFSMRGTGAGAIPVLRDTSIDLGVVEAGTVARATVRLENAGDRWLYFADDGVPWAVDPQVDLCVGTWGFTGSCVAAVEGFNHERGLAPGRAVDLPITLRTYDPGARRWNVTLRTRLADAPPLEIVVSATVPSGNACTLEAPGVIEFGSVDFARAATAPWTVKNIGTVPCELRPSAFTTLGNFSLSPPPAWPVHLAVGESATFEVRAWLDTPGLQHNGSLSLSSQPGGQSVTAVLRAKGERPCLLSDTPLVDFGAEPSSCAPRRRTVTFTNVCDATVTAERLLAPGFVALAQGVFPRTLTPGSSLSVSLEPPSLIRGTVHGRLALDVATTSGRQTLYTPLRAALADGPHVERFAAAPRQADVLVVVDGTLSTADFTRAQTNLRELQEGLAASDLDWRLGVLRADADATALLRDAEGRWVSPGATAAARFDALLTATRGPTFEVSCVKAVQRALSGAALVDANVNGGFLRERASLTVLCVSKVGETTTSAVLREVSTVKRGMRVHVAGPLGGCGVTGGDAQLQWATATNGSIWSMCIGNWWPYLSRALEGAGTQQTFMLASTPESGTVVVTVDGQRLLQGQWFLDDAAVTLVTPTREVVEVSMIPRCGP